MADYTTPTITPYYTTGEIAYPYIIIYIMYMYNDTN